MSCSNRTQELVALRKSAIDRLYGEVSGMSIDNFIVRPKRREVERFQTEAAWQSFSEEDRHILTQQIAGLPSSFKDDDLAARQFDYWVLSGQLALLRSDAAFIPLN